MITLKMLIKKYLEVERIPYGDLLYCEEWKAKRREIIKRDNNQCSECYRTVTVFVKHPNKRVFYWMHKNEDFFDQASFEKFLKADSHNYSSANAYLSEKSFVLHVHHKKYTVNKLPWQYNNDDLLTLCQWCHQKLHEYSTVPTYRVNGHG